MSLPSAPQPIGTSLLVPCFRGVAVLVVALAEGEVLLDDDRVVNRQPVFEDVEEDFDGRAKAVGSDNGERNVVAVMTMGQTIRGTATR